MIIELVVIFYCDTCNKPIKLIDHDYEKEQQHEVYCPYCKNKMYSFDDYKVQNAKEFI